MSYEEKRIPSPLQLFQREDKLSTSLNPFLCEYPACGCPLAEVLAKTKLAYITGINKKDICQLSFTPTPIIMKLSRVNQEHFDYAFDRLWHALYSMHMNVICLDLCNVRSNANVTKLGHFSQLKYLRIAYCGRDEIVGEDLAESIEAWGPQPQLTYCELSSVPIPRSLVMALCKCTLLRNLDLSHNYLHDKLSTMMVSPPQTLRKLGMTGCSLDNTDVDHITRAFKVGQLANLEHLEITKNPVTETAVGSMLEVLLSNRPHNKLYLKIEQLKLVGDSLGDSGEHNNLSEQFFAEWQTKLCNTDIDISMFHRVCLGAEIKLYNAQ